MTLDWGRISVSQYSIPKRVCIIYDSQYIERLRSCANDCNLMNDFAAKIDELDYASPKNEPAAMLAYHL